MKTKIIFNKKVHEKVFVLETETDFTFRVSKSYVTFTCKFPMVKHILCLGLARVYVSFTCKFPMVMLPKGCRSNTIFYVLDTTKLV